MFVGFSLQFRSEYEATQALALDDINFKGRRLVIKPADAAQLIPGTYGLSDYTNEQYGTQDDLGEGWSQRIVRYNEDIPGPSVRMEPGVEDMEVGYGLGLLKQSCKLRVRNVPRGVSEVEIREFFNMLMKLSGKTAIPPVVSCRITNDVAIIQFRTPKDATEALTFDSVNFKGLNLAIERVSDEPMKGVIGAGDGTGVSDDDEDDDDEEDGNEDDGEGVDDDGAEANENSGDPEFQLIVENVMGSYPSAVMKFLNQAMKSRKLNKKPGDAIVSVKKKDKENYTIVQFSSIQEANAAVALDGTNFRGRLIKVAPWASGGVQHVDKVIITNLPNQVNRKPLRFFLNRLMQRKGLSKTDKSILNIGRPKTRTSLLLQFRSKAEATKALNLTGIQYSSDKLTLRRPDNYVSPRKEAGSGDGKKGAPSPPLIAESVSHIHVSNYPRRCSDEEVRTFLNHEMRLRGLLLYPGDAIWPCGVPSTEEALNFAFVTLRSPEEATNALQLDGLEFKGHKLKISRPRDYKPLEEGEETKPLPPVPGKRKIRKARKLKRKNPELFENGPGYVRGLPLDPAYKVFVGNVSERANQEELREFINEQMRQRLLSSYNPVRSVIINAGAKFCIFQVRSHEEARTAAISLNGLLFEGRKLKVKITIPNSKIQGTPEKQTDTVTAPAKVPEPKPEPKQEQQAQQPQQRQLPPERQQPARQQPAQQQLARQQPVQQQPSRQQPAPLLATVHSYEKKVVRTPQVTYHSYQREVPQYTRILDQRYRSSMSMGPPITYQANSFSSKYTWSIATWNVMGVCADPDIQYLMDEKLSGLGIDIVAIQETHLPALTMYTKHYKWYLSGSEEGKSSGVGFLIHRDLLPAVFEWNPSSGNLAHVQLKTAHHNLALVSAFIPPPSDSQAAPVMDELLNLVSSFCPEDHILLLGDFNAEIGKADLVQEDSWFIGPYITHTHTNENGVKLKAMLHKCRLYLFSTQWDSTMVTWSDGATCAQIDHVIANCSRLITSIRDIPMPSFRTFHKLLRASVRFTTCDQHPV
ncbi:uncharacterized protein [Anabrus simplex]|uniref:uncharacterized protein isoform X2 n=1 Tax=Anabrus simplex TaxID=316456 RepID=UPI0035A283B3